MLNLRVDICYKLKEARRAAKLSQCEVAAEVGCKQSALSMFEQGSPTKLNEETVTKLAKKFNISLDAPVAEVAEAAKVVRVERSSALAFCPNPSCPSNHRYSVEGTSFLLPKNEEANPIGGKFCAICGEVLSRECPNCGAAVHAGAVCSICGERYIPVS